MLKQHDGSIASHSSVLCEHLFCHDKNRMQIPGNTPRVPDGWGLGACVFLNVFPANSVFSSLLYFCGEYNANRNSYKRKAFNWWCVCVCVLAGGGRAGLPFQRLSPSSSWLQSMVAHIVLEPQLYILLISGGKEGSQGEM